QPLGVHEASEVVDHREFPWSDQLWRGIDLDATVFYEVHVGTFTPEGTFEAMVPRLDEIRDAGITTLEIMPVAQFPGARNWGYDGTYPYAVQNSYGGPRGFKTLVNAAHAKGVAVVLDVVYNHFGPEGSYIQEYGPYFTDEYKTPWGNAINFDGPLSDQVRRFFIRNALHWFDHYHLDGLRLDAIHTIYDTSARPFLQRLAEAIDVHEAETGRRFLLIAESDLNDSKVIRPRELYGYGMDAQWSDDLHHAMQTLVKPDKGGYYVDFGTMEDLARAYADGYTYSGQYSPYRRKRFGNSSAGRPGRQFVVCTQNHDQVGNRLLGERLCTRVSLESTKLAAAVILLSPYVPLLFMGEEYGEEQPFTYFVSHGDPALIEAIRQGRRKEFEAFMFEGAPPDPEAESTFLASKVRWETRTQGLHATILAYYRELLRLRREVPALRALEKEAMTVVFSEADRTMTVRRRHPDGDVVLLFNLADEGRTMQPLPPHDRWQRLLESAATRWEGPGTTLPEFAAFEDCLLIPPCSAAAYVQAPPAPAAGSR
ncbi:MAG TPA: malto-oligosyltrehalose trehalohydrolase, partial [Bacteroidota bacterium]